MPDDSSTAWLSLGGKTGGGPLNHAGTDTVTAAINPAGLAVGDHSCLIRFTNSCSPANVVDRTVTLTVLPTGYEYNAPGLLAQYRFEENNVSSIRDWTGNGWNGTTIGTPTTAEGIAGQAFHFNGPATTAGDGVNLGAIPVPLDQYDHPGASKAMSVHLDAFIVILLGIACSGGVASQLAPSGFTGVAAERWCNLKLSPCKKITWPEKCAERHSFQYPLEGYKEP